MKKIKARLAKKPPPELETPAEKIAREVMTEFLRHDDSVETAEYREKLLRGEELSFEDAVNLAAIKMKRRNENM